MHPGRCTLSKGSLYSDYSLSHHAGVRPSLSWRQMFRSCKAPPAAVSAEVPCLEMRTYLGERDLLLVVQLQQTCLELRFNHG